MCKGKLDEPEDPANLCKGDARKAENVELANPGEGKPSEKDAAAEC